MPKTSILNKPVRLDASRPPGSILTREAGGGGAPAAVEDPSLICVDLDGTLLRTDMLAESILAAVCANPLLMFLLPFWLLKGRPFLKAKVGSYWHGNARMLPYNQPLLAYLKQRKQEGCEIWLTTASHHSQAQTIADHCGIFDRVVASSDTENLKGSRKLEAIRALVGERPFIYAGDSRADLAIWSACANAITVDTSRGVTSALEQAHVQIQASFESHPSAWRAWVKQLRVYQWSKNVLVFVPMMLGHQLQPVRLLQAALAFLAFSLCASAFYVLNDLVDIQVDRAHPRKRRRPFASGDLSIGSGFVALALILAAVIGLGALLPRLACGLLGLYACLNFAYSVRLKQVLCLDVVILAFLYTLRILFGGVATSVNVSIWTLAFAMFIFLGLALLKRLTELKSAETSGAGHMGRRPYVAADLGIVQSFASAALYLSVLVLALYLNTPDVLKLYHHAEPLWIVCILLTYWSSRMLILTNRGSMTDDPIVFAFKDRSSRVIGALVGACVLCAL